VQLNGSLGAAGDTYEREADAVADRVVAGASAAPLLSAYPLRTGAATTAVQRQEAPTAPGAPSPATEPAAAIETPVPGDNRAGFIDSDDGSNIRTLPAELAGSSTLTDAPLPPATRVFVSGKHPETDQWLYVTAISSSTGMVRGYVQGFRVNTDLPEPTANLYQIKSGDTAEQLAVQEFSSAVRDGHDLRYYENVFLHVNRQHGRAGVRGSFQDPGLLGGGANNVQLEAGRRIWLVSPAYARALEGVVPDGSLTNGAYAKAKRFVGHLEDILASVTGSYQYLDDVAGEYAQAIHDHIVEIVGIVSAFIMAEALSAFLATTPTGVGQIAAVVIQLGLAAFGAVGLVDASIQALHHAQQWLTLAWTASGKDEVIAAASKEFLKMLVSIALAALAYLGVKGNYGQATKIASNLPPPMLPAFVVGGGERAIGSSGSGAAVAASAPGPWGVFGAFATVMKDPKGEGGGGGDSPSEQQPKREPPAEESPAASHADDEPALVKDPAAHVPGAEATLRRPARRHWGATVTQKTVAKNLNTVIEPGVDVAGDVAAIRAGRATRVDGQYVVNGRTYGVHDGALYPVSGPGFHQLNRGSFQALGMLNKVGDTARGACHPRPHEERRPRRARGGPRGLESDAMIEFAGTDIVLETPKPLDCIRAAVAAALGVPDSRVAVIEDIANYPEPDSADAVGVVSSVEGDFAQLLSVQLQPMTVPYDTPLGPPQRIVDLLETRALVPIDEDNPYTMWLLAPVSPPRSASLDTDALDEERYVLARPG
jgi:hypothetical protein